MFIWTTYLFKFWKFSIHHAYLDYTSIRNTRVRYSSSKNHPFVLKRLKRANHSLDIIYATTVLRFVVLLWAKSKRRSTCLSRHGLGFLPFSKALNLQNLTEIFSSSKFSKRKELNLKVEDNDANLKVFGLG